MLRTVASLALIAATSLFTVSCFAHDIVGSDDSMHSHDYNQGQGSIKCFVVRGHTHAGRYIPRHRVCLSANGYATCEKYVVEVSPMHRDRYCSQWAWQSSYHRWHHHNCEWKH